jgi:Fe-S cluster assembly protein SufB
MAEKIIDRPELDDLGTYEFGWSDKSKAGDEAKRGISDEVVRDISAKKTNPTGCYSADLRATSFS